MARAERVDYVSCEEFPAVIPEFAGRATIVLHGRPPTRRLLRSLVRQSELLVAADGGAHAVLAAGLRPTAIVGDLDSFDRVKYPLPQGTQLCQVAEQESTDADKAIRWTLGATPARDLVLTGTQSDELDHVLGTLSVAARYAGSCRLRSFPNGWGMRILPLRARL